MAHMWVSAMTPQVIICDAVTMLMNLSIEQSCGEYEAHIKLCASTEDIATAYQFRTVLAPLLTCIKANIPSRKTKPTHTTGTPFLFFTRNTFDAFPSTARPCKDLEEQYTKAFPAEKTDVSTPALTICGSTGMSRSCIPMT